jgi:hypothetical protein
MSTKTYLTPSPVVLQRNFWFCWAAALESWLKAVNAGRQQYTQYELVGGTSASGVRNLGALPTSA